MNVIKGLLTQNSGLDNFRIPSICKINKKSLKIKCHNKKSIKIKKKSPIRP